MNRILLLSLVLTINLAGFSQGAFSLTVGTNIPLLENTPGQTIDVFLSSNNALDPALKGMNYGVYIGNSQTNVFAGDQGVFTAITLTSPTSFWTVASAQGGGPIPGFEAIGEGGVNFNSGSTAVGSGNSVKVASLTIDTTGLFSGTYSVSFTDPFGLGDPFTKTQLIDASNNIINVGPNFAISNGSFTITAVPEPSSMVFAVVMTAAAAFRYRRRIFKKMS